MTSDGRTVARQRGSDPGGGVQKTHEIMHIIEDETMIFTLDSGAFESVISEDMASQYPTRPSAGSQRGLLYTAANGSTMANHG